MKGVDRGPGHLRVGRLLIDWSVRTHPESEGPRIDGAADFLTRVHHEAECRRLRVAMAVLTGDVARVKAEHPAMNGRNEPAGLPRTPDIGASVDWVEWAREVLDNGPHIERERYDGLQLRRGGRRATFVGLRGLRGMPNPARWRPRAVASRIRWIMAGRPIPPASGHDFHGYVGIERSVGPLCERCETETVHHSDHSGGWNECPTCGWMQDIRHTPGGERGVLTGHLGLVGGYRFGQVLPGGLHTIEAARYKAPVTQEELEAAEARYMATSRHRDPWPRDKGGLIIPPPR